MKYDIQIKFNTIIFIESLKYPKTTKELFAHVQNKFKTINITCHYVSVNNKIELLKELAGIKNNKSQLFPILHIATHGDSEGLILKENSISWDELIEPITKINIRSENHLFLMVAACFGAHAINLLQSTKRAPFYIMIGPAKKVGESYLDYTILKQFYSEFSRNQNFFQALELVKESIGIGKLPFHISSSLRFFRTAISKRKQRALKEKTRHEVIQSLKNNYNTKIADKVKSKILYLEQVMELEELGFEKFKEQYFMIDLYPKNAFRFSQVKYSTFEEE